MPWSINIEEFTAEDVAQSPKNDDGFMTFELKGRYSARTIVRLPQLPLVELYDADAGGLAQPLARAETVSFTMLPSSGDHRVGRWTITARARLQGLPSGARLMPVLTDATQSLRVPSNQTLAVA